MLTIKNENDYKSYLAQRSILVIDNFLDDTRCANLIQRYNESEKTRRFDKYKKFDEVELNTELCGDLMEITGIYIDSIQISEFMFPEKYAFESARIKHYGKSDGEFVPHVDVRNADTSKRFLSFLFYLNDVEQGGETEFYLIDQNIRVKAKRGRVVVFPPMWTHPHAGLVPLSDDKYIVSAYLHYI